MIAAFHDLLKTQRQNTKGIPDLRIAAFVRRSTRSRAATWSWAFSRDVGPLLVAVALTAAASQRAADDVTFEKDVAPIIQSRCVSLPPARRRCTIQPRDARRCAAPRIDDRGGHEEPLHAAVEAGAWRR